MTFMRLSLLFGLLIAASFAQATNPAPTPATRTLTITNYCPHDVWLGSNGGNVSDVACTASSENAQGTCDSGYICYKKNVNTSYCVPGTTSSTSFPITEQSEITLTASTCSSDSVVTKKDSPSWGQCTCSSNSDCPLPSSQSCNNVTSKFKQCYWEIPFANNGYLESTKNLTLTFESIDPSNAAKTVLSGRVFAKLGCDANGANCSNDAGQSDPASAAEFTLTNGKDFYDVTYINGVNVPIAMYPVPSENNNYNTNDPYSCQAAGGSSNVVEAIVAAQIRYKTKYPNSWKDKTPNATLQSFACSNDYDTIFKGETKQGFHYVSQESNAQTCSTDSDCTGTAKHCGLTTDAVQKGHTQTYCGNHLGYWSYTQFCAINSGYVNATLGIDCATTETNAYAQCKAMGTHVGAGRSCFNANTTTSGDSCCGYENWTTAGNAQPMAPGYTDIPGVDTTYWTNNIKPVVKDIKQGCPLAYSYQYDDPYSTFTCSSTTATNEVNYEIHLCELVPM